MSGKTAGERMGYAGDQAKKEGQKLLDSFFRSFPEVEKAIAYSKEFLSKKGYVEDWAGRRRHLPDYFLKNYEVKLKDEGVMATFNPFLGCDSKTTAEGEAKIAKWKELIKDAILGSQKYQRKEAAKDNRSWEDNGEMSNMKFKKLQTEALADGVILIANTGRKAQAGRQCFNARIQGGAASLTKLAMVNIDNDQQMNDWDAHLVITVHDEVLVECPAYYSELVEKRLPQIMIDTAKPYINVPMSCDPANESRWYASEFSIALEEEFKHLEEKLTREEALNKLCENHSEVPSESIIKLIEGKTEQIEF